MIVPTLSQASGWQEARDRYGANVVFLRHALALEYIKLGQLNDAKALFLAVLSDNPDYVGSYYHLAKLLETLEEREAAIQWYEKGMEAAKKAGDNHALNELRAAYEDLVF